MAAEAVSPSLRQRCLAPHSSTGGGQWRPNSLFMSLLYPPPSSHESKLKDMAHPGYSRPTPYSGRYASLPVWEQPRMGAAEDLELDASTQANFFSREDIVSKAHAIEQTEREHRYRQLPENAPNFWRRLRRAAMAVPKEHRLALIALACNTVYIFDSLLKGILRQMAGKLTKRCNELGVKTKDVQVFTLDHPGLLDELYQVGGNHGWTARIDRAVDSDFRSIREFVTDLDNLSTAQAEQRAAVATVFNRRVWVFLADNVLSGTSAASDIKRAQILLETFLEPDRRPIIILGAEILTSKALNDKLLKILPDNQILRGIFLDDRFSITNQNCSLFKSESTLLEVRSFCEWFGNHYFSSQLSLFGPDSERNKPHPLSQGLAVHSKKGRHDFAHGWGDGGYTLVLQGNCPNNTEPALWYPCVGDEFKQQGTYSPPFPRNPSRISYPKSHTDEILARVIQKSGSIREIIERAQP